MGCYHYVVIPRYIKDWNNMPDFKLGGANPTSYLGVRASTPPQMVVRQRAPLQTDDNFVLGTQWLHWVKATPSLSVQYVLVSVAQNVAVWLPLHGSGAGGIIAKTYSTPGESGTHVLNSGTTMVEVMGWGAGGRGGNGSNENSPPYGAGGSGGSGAPFSQFKLPVSFLSGTSIAYTVALSNGAHTTFGDLVISGGVNGLNGSGSTFGTLSLSAGMSLSNVASNPLFGQLNVSTSTSVLVGPSAGGIGESGAGVGGRGGNGIGNVMEIIDFLQVAPSGIVSSFSSAGGGAGGGGINTGTPLANGGGIGGNIYSYPGHIVVVGGTAGATGGGAGGHGATSIGVFFSGGSGAGGGGGNLGATGGAGGNGAFPGGGGGGGGGGKSFGGLGGTGAGGMLIVIEYT